MFMFNDTTKQLILPIALADTIKTQQCNVTYGLDGKEVKKDCYPTEQALTTFAGLKGWNVGVDKLTESMSVNYTSILRNPYNNGPETLVTADPAMPVSTGPIDPWIFQALMSRVGFINNQYFMVNTQFAHFFTAADQTGTMIPFPGNASPNGWATPMVK
jgi:hypothetical protein